MSSNANGGLDNYKVRNNGRQERLKDWVSSLGIDEVKSLNPVERLELVKNLKLDGKSQPVRRVWIPKPGRKENRPLGIPTIKERVVIIGVSTSIYWITDEV